MLGSRFATDNDFADEARLAQRFNSRAFAFFWFLIFVYAALVFGYFLFGASAYFTFINFLMLAIAAGLLFTTRDAVMYFVASHPAWMFSFSAYIYSMKLLKPVEEGLYGADQSIMIALVYQLACATAFLVYIAVQWNKRRSHRAAGRGAILSLQRYRGVLVLVGVVANISALAASDGTISSVAEQANIYLWLGVALHFFKSGKFRLDVSGIVILAIFVGAAIYGNSRTFVFEFGLVSLLAYVYYSDRLLDYRFLILAYLGFNFLMLFSTISLDIRLNGGRESSVPMMRQYADKLLTPETLLFVINPFSSHSSRANVRDIQEQSYGQDRFWYAYFSAGDSFGERFVLLPQLDIVCGQYGDVSQTRWDALANVVISSLPNLGQEKDLNYNDELTWDLGLRDYGVVGKPMLTNACELYTMSGLLGMYVISLIEFLLIFLFLRILKDQLEFSILYVVTLVVAIMYVTVTTSSLGVASTAIRGLPLCIFFIWLAKQIAVWSFGPGVRRFRPTALPLR